MSEMNRNGKIPDIVEKKIQEAYSQIREESKAMKKEESKNMNNERKVKKTVRPRIIIASCAAVAAAAVCVTATVPAFANNIPFFKHAYEVVTGNYQKNPILKNDLSQYSATLNADSTGENADVTMQSAYFDGENISIEFVLVPESDILKNNVTNIEADIKADIDGNKLYRDEYRKDNSINEDTIGFVKADDGNFYATVYYTASDSEYETSKEYGLNVEISDIYGTNNLKQIWVPVDSNAEYMSYDYCVAGGYEPEKTEVLSDKFTFSENITAKNLSTDYEVNKTEGTFTLEKISVSPFSTDVYIDGIKGDNGIRLKDESGNEIESIDGLDNERIKFETPLKPAKSLTVEIFDINQDGFPAIASFNVDINGGYAENISNEYTDDDSKTVYTPSEDELNAVVSKVSDNGWEEVKNNVKPEKLGTKIKEIDESGEKTYEVSITGSRIVDIDEFLDGIDSETADWYKTVYKENISDMKMLLVDYKLENNSNEDLTTYFMGLSFLPKDFVFKEDEVDIFNEPHYQSEKDNGGKSSYKYTLKANSERTLTYGYPVTKEMAEKGFYAFGAKDESVEPSSYEDYTNLLRGTYALLEIE